MFGSGPKLRYLMDLNDQTIGSTNNFLISEITDYYLKV